jgi:hypothetical protein
MYLYSIHPKSGYRFSDKCMEQKEINMLKNSGFRVFSVYIPKAFYDLITRRLHTDH